MKFFKETLRSWKLFTSRLIFHSLVLLMLLLLGEYVLIEYYIIGLLPVTVYFLLKDIDRELNGVLMVEYTMKLLWKSTNIQEKAEEVAKDLSGTYHLTERKPNLFSNYYVYKIKVYKK